MAAPIHHVVLPPWSTVWSSGHLLRTFGKLPAMRWQTSSVFSKSISIAKTTDEVRKAIAEFWLGVDVGDEIEQELRVIAEHDFEEMNVAAFEFEIGGARFEDVTAD